MDRYDQLAPFPNHTRIIGQMKNVMPATQPWDHLFPYSSLKDWNPHSAITYIRLAGKLMLLNRHDDLVLIVSINGAESLNEASHVST